MNDDTAVIPPWLHDVFLGYGDPGAAQSRVPGATMTAIEAAAAREGGGAVKAAEEAPPAEAPGGQVGRGRWCARARAQGEPRSGGRGRRIYV